MVCETCKKYPDGGNSLLLKKKIYGKKIVTLYTVDGIDSLRYLEDSVFKCNDYYIDFTKETTSDADDKGYNSLSFTCNANSNHYICGLQAWSASKEGISFSYFPSSAIGLANLDLCSYIEKECPGLIKNPFCGDWKFTKLTRRELLIEKTKNNHVYKLYLNEIR